MSIEMYILTGLVTVVICVATFFGGKLSAAKAEGERLKAMEVQLAHLQDKMESKIDHMREMMETKINSVQVSLTEFRGDYMAELGNFKNEFKVEIQGLHDRINRHLRVDHGINTGKDGVR